MVGADPGWWRHAVVYQIYIRSFADSNGDGIGDIGGIRSRLRYLEKLGVDAIWINPWYPSPMADGGYDVADYYGIDPSFGTLADATDLIAAAHEHGIRVILDIVPNHTSDEHPWFRAAAAGLPNSPERARYHIRTGRGPGGVEPPTDWLSVFGGPAWSRLPGSTATPAEWYLHLFDPKQPDLDWSNPEVAAEFERVLRFWFDRGVDGFRVDVAHGLAKDGRFPDGGPSALVWPWPGEPGTHPHWDRDEVHDVYRAWRAIADGYSPARVFVGEVDAPTAERRARYLRPDEFQMAFDLEFLASAWDPANLRRVIDGSIAAVAAVGSSPTWVLSNHDNARHATRYGRADSSWHGKVGAPVDRALGLRRARAAALLMLALPGGAYLYQGEELGLPDVEDLPDELLQDPVWTRSGRIERGRDGCRVPLPWSGQTAPFGFGPAASIPWLPQPPEWGSMTVEAEDRDPGSMLSLYRSALRLRRAIPSLTTESFAWAESDPTVLRFERGPELACVVNLGRTPIVLPSGADILLASVDGVTDRLPVDAATWYRPD